MNLNKYLIRMVNIKFIRNFVFIFLVLTLFFFSISVYSFEGECGDGICYDNLDYYSCPEDCEGFDASISSSLNIIRGHSVTIPVELRQYQNHSIDYRLNFSEEFESVVEFESENLTIENSGMHLLPVTFNVSEDLQEENLYGSIYIETEHDSVELPISLEIIFERDRSVSLSNEIYSSEVFLGDELIYFLSFDFYIPIDFENVKIELLATHLESDEVFYIDSYNITATSSFRDMRQKTLDRETFLNEEDGSEVNLGRYNLVTNLIVNETVYQSTSVFTLSQSFFDTIYFRIILIFLIGSPLLIVTIKGYNKYKKYKQQKQRYITPDLKDLPNKNMNTTMLEVGKLAGTRHKAYLAARDLTTHGLVAGSTGSGKSVSASIIVEEALNEKIPVVVFDPTSQWTGFLSSLKDKNIFKYYPKFNLKKEDARSYKGLIFTPEDANFELNFEEYLNPGEITVFNLANLNIQDYDQAVAKIIEKIFEKNWEEDPELKLLCVFDEVHRLLDSSCSGDGYAGLIRGAREFRKWGIGLLMASQVSSDFKGEIGGNVLTEVQLNTKNMNDIKKAEEKYGGMYAKRITRQGVGVAMVQNPQYNDGKPWFIHFRPPLHNPHKLSEEDLEKYNKFTSQLKVIKEEIKSKEDSNQDTSDLELDYNLANNKLKEGRFKMTEIYIQSLQEKLGLK